MTPIVEGGDVVEPLRERVLGRMVAEDVYLPGNDAVPIVTRDTLLDEKWVASSKRPACSRSRCARRSPARRATASARYCYGRDLGRGHLVNIGEAVGVIAAQSIGEPGTQLTMRTFHIGGAASRAAAVDNVEVKTNGTVQVQQPKTVHTSKGHLVAVSRSGECRVIDDTGRERERYKLPYGAVHHRQGRRSDQGRPDHRELGSAHPPDRVGSGRLRALHRLHRRHDRQSRSTSSPAWHRAW